MDQPTDVKTQPEVIKVFRVSPGCLATIEADDRGRLVVIISRKPAPPRKNIDSGK